MARSISWAIAQAAGAAGARLALTYPSERLEENVRALAAKLENPLVLPCDVSSDQQIADVFTNVEDTLLALEAGGHLAEFTPQALKDFPEGTQVGIRATVSRADGAADGSAYRILVFPDDLKAARVVLSRGALD